MNNILNANPKVYEVSKKIKISDIDFDINEQDETREPIDNEEIFDLIRTINDPEHPLTLEQLNVIRLESIHVEDSNNYISVTFYPTIPHCSMATLIGLCIRVRLLRSLPSRFKIDIFVAEGTHQTDAAVNKQLNDKERVAAALENTHLLKVVNQCLIEKNYNDDDITI
ncbi:DUF59-domain-containing protein [Neocallimastix lanati (nom. inval.)]|jgi:metal-sulfur cluster biosynthetic enzyme|uniref:DUF59-domain-containing protein n=1 Tax=Neocallimastix californiae TaxID=1754190 RepID=A0A1Y2EXV9_9FUNG|nr:DUF59-domain-containing protein [Neocallimastix sp. JGI-2020a]KAG4084977.1 DUF59-domain-containing protein [Neocallimastix sp. JGI-2020a]KAG4086027.1 DUF59-domain-containing protein [Neocallimastix sp. JGI-2020a]ORY76433.1 DUF59-domain-containing protein [Neocallimastix californiae]|eukprot:ORY76433.1 DUF59-domain-containing protein [Neocallimastix californiae]